MFKKSEIPEIIIPKIYNTYEKPKEPSNYTVYIPRDGCIGSQIYISGKWFDFIQIIQDELREEDKNKNDKYEISEVSYKLLKAIKNFLKEDNI